MKMTSVIQPQTFLAGVGQYSYDEMLHGLSWLAASSDDLLAGLSGLGQLSTKGSVMDAIINNAGEMTGKMSTLEKARMKASASDPVFAMKLSAAMKKTGVPGTNVAAGVLSASKEAAAKAYQAKLLEAKARVLLSQNDKRGAAAESVNALTAAREALIISTSAEKTRLTSALDSVANTLESQARYVDQQVANENSRSGGTGRTDSLRASAHHLRTEAGKLRTQSALVERASTVPPNAPTQKRIAEVANKFNIRAVGRGTDANVLSVLSDLSEDAMAKTRDYDGAMQFYGADAVGRMMCDMEFENNSAAIKGLSQAIHGMGYMDTLPVFAQADRTLRAGVRSAQTGFTGAVLPAFVGRSKGLAQMQEAAVSLGGLGRPYAFTVGPAEADKWDRVCAEEYGPGGKTPNDEQLQKCLKPGFGCDMFQPWEAVGRACRGNISLPTMFAEIGKGIVSGDVKLPPIPNLPGNSTPPKSTLPPATIPFKTPTGYTTPNQQSGSSTDTYVQPGSYGLPSGNTMLYAGIGVGALALGTAVWYTMFRKPTGAY